MGMSSYSGKGSGSSYTYTSRSNSNIGKMRKALDLLEELEDAKLQLEAAQKRYDEVERKVINQLNKLSPETRARFQSLLGTTERGGQDR